jgi:hypothetical protein
MKTTKMISVLSILLFVSTLFPMITLGIGNKNNQTPLSPVIRYEVNVILPAEKNLCNTYYIVIRDESGKMVAPVKPLAAGISKYLFYERGPAKGARIATLEVSNYGDRYICDRELFANPAVLFGLFETGKTYRFDLFPSYQNNR